MLIHLVIILNYLMLRFWRGMIILGCIGMCWLIRLWDRILWASFRRKWLGKVVSLGLWLRFKTSLRIWSLNILGLHLKSCGWRTSMSSVKDKLIQLHGLWCKIYWNSKLILKLFKLSTTLSETENSIQLPKSNKPVKSSAHALVTFTLMLNQP